jgi:hypothetical protein
VTDRILPHEHDEFDALLSIVAEKRSVAAALVEKDYWVTHSLWALQESGLRIEDRTVRSQEPRIGSP